MENKKPPLGLTPRWLLDEDRVIEIKAAIERYDEVNMPVPIEWYIELQELYDRLSKFYHVEYGRVINLK